MIRSMTGFGAASAEVDNLHYSVELRSVNNRYFKVSTRLPDEIAGLEAMLEATLRRRITRGSCALTVKLRVSSAMTSTINDAALLNYLDHLETVREKVQDQSVQIDLTQLLALPGVLAPTLDGEAMLERGAAVLPGLVDQAADRLIEMRETEGRALSSDLLKQEQQMRRFTAIIAKRAPTVVEEYHQKLAQRVEALMAKAKLSVDEHDLIREVAVFADRSDISEELSRMSGHLEQFAQVLASDGPCEPAGRTMDFIAQEMLREANTIGSKSNDAQISRAVVQVKSRIDRIKEQVQNVE